MRDRGQEELNPTVFTKLLGSFAAADETFRKSVLGLAICDGCDGLMVNALGVMARDGDPLRDGGADRSNFTPTLVSI